MNEKNSLHVQVLSGKEDPMRTALIIGGAVVGLVATAFLSYKLGIKAATKPAA